MWPGRGEPPDCLLAAPGLTDGNVRWPSILERCPPCIPPPTPRLRSSHKHCIQLGTLDAAKVVLTTYLVHRSAHSTSYLLGFRGDIFTFTFQNLTQRVHSAPGNASGAHFRIPQTQTICLHKEKPRLKSQADPRHRGGGGSQIFPSFCKQ